MSLIHAASLKPLFEEYKTFKKALAIAWENSGLQAYSSDAQEYVISTEYAWVWLLTVGGILDFGTAEKVINPKLLRMPNIALSLTCRGSHTIRDDCKHFQIVFHNFKLFWYHKTTQEYCRISRQTFFLVKHFVCEANVANEPLLRKKHTKIILQCLKSYTATGEVSEFLQRSMFS